MALFKLIHLLAVLIWVGGMFFAYVVLRPAAVEVLEAPNRLRLWVAVFSRFFKWVWGAIGVLLASGFYMISLYGGMASAPRFIHVMLLLGIVMVLIFCYVYFRCYAQLAQLVAKQEWPKAGGVLATIRKLVAVNLTLGVLTVCVAVVTTVWS
jgi:uncharacterized membrane protein